MNQTLRARLQQQQDEISASWQEKIFASYPPETAAFLQRQDDRFAYPVGHMFRQGTKRILEILIEEGPEANAPLQELMKSELCKCLVPRKRWGLFFPQRRYRRHHETGIRKPSSAFFLARKQSQQQGAEPEKGFIGYASAKWLWLGALAFHWSLLLIIARHLRFFVPQESALILAISQLDSFLQIGAPLLYLTDIIVCFALAYLIRRFLIPQVRYIGKPTQCKNLC